MNEKYIEYLLAYIKLKSRDYKETMLNFNKELANVLIILSNHYALPQRTIPYFLGFIVEKIIDSKFIDQCHQILFNLGKLHKPGHILKLIQLLDIKRGQNTN